MGFANKSTLPFVIRVDKDNPPSINSAHRLEFKRDAFRIPLFLI